jgi:hypothetical protein
MTFAEIHRHFSQCLKLVAVCLMLVHITEAQEQAQQLTAPPPPKVISKEDKARLDATKDPKERLKLSLELAENHLLSAEQFTAHPNYEAASGEVGKYFALIDDTLKFLSTLNQEKNKTRDLYKKMELALRAHGPRLTAMRRETPLEYAVWIKEVEEFARDGRSEALNSFYGHTVVRESSPKTPSDKILEPKRGEPNSLAPPEKKP